MSLPDVDTDSARPRIVVVGDSMIDRYVDGSVKRISPEAPVPVLSIDRIYERAGGAANVAANLAALGAETTLITVVGDDGQGDILRRLLSEYGVVMAALEAAGHPTIQKIRYVANRHQLLRADSERLFTEVHAGEVAEMVEDALPNADFVVLSDYAKGTLLAVRRLIAMCVARGIPCIVDPKGSDFSIYAGATLIKPNAAEFATIFGAFDARDPGALAGRASAACGSLEIANMLVTLGEHGMALFDTSGLVHHEQSKAHEVFDVSGAGDTVIATLAFMLASRRSMRDSVTVASAAAGLVVRKFGTSIVTRDELAAVGGGMFP